MESEPLTVGPDDLVADIADQIKEVALPGGGGRRRAQPSGRAGRPLGPGRPEAAAGAARRPRRAGAERARRRPGGDRRDPRPPPHRLDRDARPGDGDLRSGRLDRHPGDRALPSERARAEPPDRDAAARRDPLRHGDPQLAHDHRARPRGGRLPRAGARDRRDGVRPRDVRGDLRRLGASRPRRSSRATPRSTRPRAARRSASPRSRPSARACSSARPSCSRRWRPRASAAATTSMR